MSDSQIIELLDLIQQRLRDLILVLAGDRETREAYLDD